VVEDEKLWEDEVLLGGAAAASGPWIDGWQKRARPKGPATLWHCNHFAGY